MVIAQLAFPTKVRSPAWFSGTFYFRRRQNKWDESQTPRRNPGRARCIRNPATNGRIVCMGEGNGDGFAGPLRVEPTLGNNPIPQKANEV